MNHTVTEEFLTQHDLASYQLDLLNTIDDLPAPIPSKWQADQAVEIASDPNVSKKIKNAANQLIGHINKVKQFLEPIVNYIKNYKQIANLCARVSLGIKRTHTHRTQRSTRRSTTKRAKPSGSSDSDGGPSASDSSDRCNRCNTLCYTPLLYSPRCSSNKFTTLCTPASYRFIYSHVHYRISIFLSWLTFSALRTTLIDITTWHYVGVNHV